MILTRYVYTCVVENLAIKVGTGHYSFLLHLLPTPKIDNGLLFSTPILNHIVLQP